MFNHFFVFWNDKKDRKIEIVYLKAVISIVVVAVVVLCYHTWHSVAMEQTRNLTGSGQCHCQEIYKRQWNILLVLRHRDEESRVARRTPTG